ncbi:unnamed protein product [Medioppia subpectinata]|uniref:Uncharacterized protein n=1 Tax=Medioppia subpectinata TaxID=1979941 RepID=A0A7R9KU73_9ACAR|nr:unnamed protein product [Medioppia subpectinata]CAG2108756.1 unnamed protein product [Medioppia subpectinata]
MTDEKVNEIRSKLDESMTESRQLRLSLMDTQTNVALMRTELAQLRNQYDHKCRELTHEVGRMSEQQSEQQHLTRQLSLLQDANKRLHDTNDNLRSVLELTPTHSRNHTPDGTDGQLPGFKRGSLVGDYLQNDGFKDTMNNRQTFSRLSETDMESISVYEEDYQSQRQSFASCPPMSGLKSVQLTGDEMDSGLSSMRTRSHQSSPVLMHFYRRTSSPIDDSSISVEPSGAAAVDIISDATGAPERTYKIIFIGDASVGKSTFILRLSKGYFATNLSTTLGVDFQMRTCNFDGMNIALQLWDTAGQERYRSITKNYFRKADGIMLLYDVTNEQSFLNVREWISTIEEAKTKGVPVMIVGNKTDLRSTLMAQDMKYVRAEDGYKIAQQYGLMFVETSCKDGQNIMTSIAELIKIMTQNEDNLIQSVLKLSEEKPKRFGCCSK